MEGDYIKNISIIGSGNLGYHLAKRFQEKGLIIDQVFSRKEKNARKLAEILNTSYCTQLLEIQTISDLYVLAISDDAIQKVAQQLSQKIPKNSLIVHTSGATPSSVFADYFSNYGVFYPLQSLSIEKEVNFTKVPLCVFANQNKDQENLLQLAQQISQQVSREFCFSW